LGREIDLPLALMGVMSAALEMGQSVNAKKAVKINTCAESLLILDAAPRKLNVVLCVKAFCQNYWRNVLHNLMTIVANHIPISCSQCLTANRLGYQ
jgi:hypothetical protein